MFNFPSGGGAGTFSPDRTTEAARLKKRQEEEKKRAAALAKIERDRLKVEQNKLKVAKEQAALQKAGTIFDQQQTSIIAALKGKISDEERTRLELQLAILTGNSAEASKLAGQLAKSQGLTQELVAYLKNLPDAKNPFLAWKSYLDMIEAQAKKIAGDGSGGGGGGGTVTVPIVPRSINDGGPIPGSTQVYPGDFGDGGAVGAPVSVVVMLDGAELTNAVTKVQTNNSLSGSMVEIFRRAGSFATP
jgi:hypothetical protein